MRQRNLAWATPSGKRAPASTPARGLTPVRPLTKRELEVAGLLMDGLCDKDMSGRLKITLKTVHTFNHRIYKKAGVHTRLEFVKWYRGKENETDLNAINLPELRGTSPVVYIPVPAKWFANLLSELGYTQQATDNDVPAKRGELPEHKLQSARAGGQ